MARLLQFCNTLLDALLTAAAWWSGRQAQKTEQKEAEVDDVQKVVSARADRDFMRRVHDRFRR